MVWEFVAMDRFLLLRRFIQTFGYIVNSQVYPDSMSYSEWVNIKYFLCTLRWSLWVAHHSSCSQFCFIGGLILGNVHMIIFLICYKADYYCITNFIISVLLAETKIPWRNVEKLDYGSSESDSL